MIPRKFSLKTLNQTRQQTPAGSGFMGQGTGQGMGQGGVRLRLAAPTMPKVPLKLIAIVLGAFVVTFVGVTLTMGVAPTPQTVTLPLGQN